MMMKFIFNYFHDEKFRESFINHFNNKNTSYDAFEHLLLNISEKMTPIKQKYIRGNQSPVMNKDIHRAIRTRTRLRNRFLKEATPMNRLEYKKRMNYHISVMHENKKNIVVL